MDNSQLSGGDGQMEVHGISLTGLLGSLMTMAGKKILLKSTLQRLGSGMMRQMLNSKEEPFVSMSQKIFKMGTVIKTAAQDFFLSLPR